MQPNLPPEIRQLAEHQAMHCRVMGNSQRILILWLLADKEQTVSEISAGIGASLQTTSHHLRILKFNNMVKSRHENHNVFYHLNDNESVKRCPVLTNSPKGKLMVSLSIDQNGFTKGESYDNP